MSKWRKRQDFWKTSQRDPWARRGNLHPMKLPRSVSSSEPGRTLQPVCVTVVAVVFGCGPGPCGGGLKGKQHQEP